MLNFNNQFLKGVYESQWIKIELGKNSGVIIGNVYRPNSAPLANINIAIDTHQSIINQIKNDKTLKKYKLHICGDMNIDLLKVDIHDLTNQFLNCHLIVKSGILFLQ